MSTATLAPPKSPSAAYEPQPYRWTCDEFHDLGDRGYFDGRRAMLIDGEILTMPMANPAHNLALNKTYEVLRARFAGGHHVRNQMALDVGLANDPGPDLAVVAGSFEDYADRQATTALLVVEIADSSLAFDRGPKSNLYAAANVQEYWVLDLNGQQLFAYRDPVADADAPRGFRYATVLTFAATERAAPLAAPQSSVLVAELLP